VRILALLVIALLLISPAIGPACVDLSSVDGAGTSSTTDQYEPNGDLDTATPLVVGTALQSSIGSRDDYDVFRCDAPESSGPTRFRVEVESSRSEHLEVEVGASIPGAFEGISWPGWEAERDGDSIVVRGELTAGTVLVFISGTESIDYSIQIVWE
jgi:hypothetical protein